MEYMLAPRYSSPGVLIRVPPKKCKTKKKLSTKSKVVAKLSRHVGSYRLLAKLARAPSSVTFGQLARCDADDAKKEVQKSTRSGTRKTKIGPVGDTSFPRRVKMFPIKMYSKETQSHLDYGADITQEDHN